VLLVIHVNVTDTQTNKQAISANNF